MFSFKPPPGAPRLLVPVIFLFPISKFVAIVEQRLEDRRQQKTTRKIYVDVAQFVAYCAKARYPSRRKCADHLRPICRNKQIPSERMPRRSRPDSPARTGPAVVLVV